MRIDKTQTVAGYPLLKIRDFLKKHEQFSYRSVAGYFEVNEKAATGIIESLLSAGYIQQISGTPMVGKKPLCHMNTPLLAGLLL